MIACAQAVKNGKKWAVACPFCDTHVHTKNKNLNTRRRCSCCGKRFRLRDTIGIAIGTNVKNATRSVSHAKRTGKKCFSGNPTSFAVDKAIKEIEWFEKKISNITCQMTLDRAVCRFWWKIKNDELASKMRDKWEKHLRSRSYELDEDEFIRNCEAAGIERKWVT